MRGIARLRQRSGMTPERSAVRRGVMASADSWWRVQAVWTVGGELRRYAPVLCEGRKAADKAAREMAATLCHFPTLEVVVAPASGEEVEAERATA